MLRYSSTWKLSLQNHLCHVNVYRWKALDTRDKKNHHLFCVVSNDARMYHNKIDTLHLVWDVTSEQMINSKFFLLGTWCHPLMWCETQSTVKRKVFTNFAMQTTFANFFTNLSIRKLLVWWQWRSVASSKPRSHICDILSLFPMRSVNFLKGPALIFLTINFIIFKQKKPRS